MIFCLNFSVYQRFNLQGQKTIQEVPEGQHDSSCLSYNISKFLQCYNAAKMRILDKKSTQTPDVPDVFVVFMLVKKLNFILYLHSFLLQRSRELERRLGAQEEPPVKLKHLSSSLSSVLQLSSTMFTLLWTSFPFFGLNLN